MTNDIVKKIQDQVQADIKDDVELCEKEQNTIEKIKLIHKIQIKTFRKILENMTSMTDEEFTKMYEVMTTPTETKFKELMDNEKNIAYENLKNAEEFEEYKKIQDLEIQQNKNHINLLNEFTFEKKSLERLLIFYITALGQTAIEQRVANMHLLPLIESTLLVNRQFGFDMNWLMGMSMIQLHENMIKKKFEDLGGEIKQQKLHEIILDLDNLIKSKENRDVTLSLDMSDGLKKIRNRLTHAGFKHAISPDDLKIISHEIKRLEQTLFPETQ